MWATYKGITLKLGFKEHATTSKWAFCPKNDGNQVMGWDWVALKKEGAISKPQFFKRLTTSTA